MAIIEVEHTGTGSFQLLSAVSGITAANIEAAEQIIISATAASGAYSWQDSPTTGHPIAADTSVVLDLRDNRNRTVNSTSLKIKGSGSTVFVITLWL
jgi:hypothetical protein